MVSQTQANYSLNIGLHVFILFTFLTIFFFAYASKLEKKSIQNALGGIVDKQIGKFLTQVDVWDKKLKPDSYPNVNWNAVNNLAKKLEKNSQGELPEIIKNNTRLKWIGMAMVVILFVLLIGMYAYFKMVKKYDVHLGRIFTENLVIFAFVGVIEFLFFKHIAAKYIPTTPDFVATTILERVKYRTSYALIDK